MLILIKKLLKLLFKIAVSKRLYTMLSLVYSFVIEELAVDGTTIRSSKHAKNNKYTILVLSSKSFRKDLDCIVATNEFRVLRIPDHWQSRLIYQFYPGEFQKYLVGGWNPDNSDFKYKKEQKELREFLQHFFSKLYKKIAINCVISPHPRYVVDMDWGAVSTKMGVPHILINRDSQFASSPHLFNRLEILFRDSLPKFEGRHVIVQSELDVEAYVDTGYVDVKNISSLGCPRMDELIRKSKEKGRVTEERRKKIVFLAFIHTETGTYETSDLLPYVEELHLFFVRFAIQYPEIDVVMKPKPKSFHGWKEKILCESIKGSSIDLNRIPNLIARGDIDIHTLLCESDVVCGIDTSVLLEAAVIGLPVIIPYFKDLQNPKYDKRVFYRDAYDLFDIAESLEDLEFLILKRLQNSVIEKDIMEGRKALFEKFISSVEGGATEKYVTLIKEIVNKQNGDI